MMNYALSILAVSVAAVTLRQEDNLDDEDYELEDFSAEDDTWFNEMDLSLRMEQFANATETFNNVTSAISDYKRSMAFLPNIDVSLPSVNYDWEGDEGLDFEGPSVDVYFAGDNEEVDEEGNEHSDHEDSDEEDSDSDSDDDM